MAHNGARIASHNTHKPYPGQQVNWSNDLTNNLALLLPYQDRTGLTVYESVRNAYTSSVAYQATPTWLNSNIGPSAGFTSAGFPNYITVANDATYGLQNAPFVTLHMLIYPTNLSGTSDQYLVARQSIWSFQLAHSSSFTPTVNITASSSFPSITSTTAPIANQWNALTCTFSYTTPVTGSIWLNGQNVTNTVNGGTGTIGPDSGHAVSIQGLSSVTFLGYFGLFGWWTRMLTSAEIQSLHQNPWQLWRSDQHRYPTIAATYTQNLTAGVGCAGGLTKTTSKQFAGGIGTAGALTKTTGKGLSGALSASGALVRGIAKSLAGGVGTAGALSKNTGKLVSGSVALSGTVKKQINKTLSGTVNAAGTIQKSISKSLSSAVQAASNLTKNIAKTFLASINVAATAFSGSRHIGTKAQPGRLISIPAYWRTTPSALATTDPPMLAKNDPAVLFSAGPISMRNRPYLLVRNDA